MEKESFEKNGAKCSMLYGVNGISNLPFNSKGTEFKFKFDDFKEFIQSDFKEITIGKCFSMTSIIYIEEKNEIHSYKSLTQIEPLSATHQYELYLFIALKHLKRHIDILLQKDNNSSINKDDLKSKLEVCLKEFLNYE